MIIFIICSCWLSIVAKCKRIKLSIALIETTWNVLGMGGIARTGHNATVIVQWCVGCVHGCVGGSRSRFRNRTIIPPLLFKPLEFPTVLVVSVMCTTMLLAPPTPVLSLVVSSLVCMDASPVCGAAVGWFVVTGGGTSFTMLWPSSSHTMRFDYRIWVKLGYLRQYFDLHVVSNM